MNSAVAPLSPSSKSFSIWRDTRVDAQPFVDPIDQCIAPTPTVNRRILAQKNNNLPNRPQKHKHKIQLIVQSDTHVAREVKDISSASDGTRAAPVPDSTQSPLDHLPQKVKSMILQQSFASPGYMRSEQTLIAAADALDLRRKLMETEVPLSSRVRSPEHLNVSCQGIERGSVVVHKPKLVSPPKMDVNPRTLGQPRLAETYAIDRTPATGLLSPNCPPPTRSVTPMLSLYATVKVTNIPWDASTSQILEFLGKNTRLAMYTSICSPVHFVLDRTSGKTQSDIYIEIVSIDDAERFAQRKTGRSLGSRAVSVELVSSKEMLCAIFPRYRDGHWLTPEEIQNVLTHAKTFKSPYTRKCPQRPFENFISMLALFPWANKAAYAESQVQLLYMGYTSIVSILQWHIRKGKIPGLDTALLHRLVIAGTNLTDFSVEQKKLVCSSVNFYPAAVAPPVPVLRKTSSGNDYSKTSCTNETSIHSLLPAQVHNEIALPVAICPQFQVSQFPATRAQLLPQQPWTYGKTTTSNSSSTSESLPDALVLKESLLKIQATNQVHGARVHSKPFSRNTAETRNPSSDQIDKYNHQQPGTVSAEHNQSTRDKWLANARKAGIAVGVPTTTYKCLPR